MKLLSRGDNNSEGEIKTNKKPMVADDTTTASITKSQSKFYPNNKGSSNGFSGTILNPITVSGPPKVEFADNSKGNCITDKSETSGLPTAGKDFKINTKSSVPI